ncbi:MAG: uracil-DNA glycosylase [Desulfotalea sp.]|nr:MAG: uracil-DNA glycosylase [Desulfotalea sp.]
MDQNLLWEENVPFMMKGLHKTLLEKAFSPADNPNPVYPDKANVFTALRETSLSDTKVVIIGQDPYFNFHPGKGAEAHGLSFSVRQGFPIPPSLRNILKEVNNSIYNGAPVSTESDLSRWAKQGVLLLNASLTVIAKNPNSHAKLGWHQLTDNIIETISQKRSHVVFMLWGAFAQKKTSLIDTSKHLILATSHPSPLSAYRGFLGSEVFCRCNEYLHDNSVKEITW